MVGKAGPWFDPQFENSLKKISLQLGIATPSQVGLELGKKKSGEKTAIEMKQLSSPTKLANDLQQSLPKESGEGRPKLSKDQTKRKEKTFSPQTGANLALWASSAQDDISNFINPLFLQFAKKDNLRQLTASEYSELEILKTKLLFSIKPYASLTSEHLQDNLEKVNSSQINKALATYKTWLKEIESRINDPISTEQIKQAKSYFYSLVYSSSDTL
jgi:hypothetical protein